MNAGLETVEEIDWKKLPNYDHEQVRQLLSTLPNNIWKAGRVRDEAEQKLAQLKQALKVELAKAHLVARAKKDLSSNDDRKAWAITRPEVMELEEAIIMADGELAAAKLNYERLDNWFTATRKVASMLMDIEKQVENTTKYGRGPNG